MYQIYNSQCPPVLRNLISKSNATRVTRNKLRVDIPRSKYVDYKKSFCHRGSVLWNNIPSDIKESLSYETFKSVLSKSVVLDHSNFGISATGTAGDHEIYLYY